MQPMPYGSQQNQMAQQQTMFQNQPPPPQQQWYPNQGQTHNPAQQYNYGQQLPPAQVPGPRYDRPIMNNQNTKQAISNMLRQRQPSNQFMGPQQPAAAPPVAGPTSFQGMHRQQYIRQQLRAQHGTPAMNQQQLNMFASQQQQQQGMYSGMQQGSSEFFYQSFLLIVF